MSLAVHSIYLLMYSEEFPVQTGLDRTSPWLKQKISEKEKSQLRSGVAERELA